MNLIPRGLYTAMVVPVEAGNGRVFAQFGRASTGTDQVALVFEILESEYAGVRLTWFGSFTDKSEERTLKALRFVGFKGDDLSSLPYQALNQRVQVEITHEVSQKNNKTYAKIQWINELGGGGVRLSNRLDDSAVRMLSARMKAKVKAIGEVEGEKGEAPAASNVSTNGASPAAREPGSDDPGADDPLPF